MKGKNHIMCNNHSQYVYEDILNSLYQILMDQFSSNMDIYNLQINLLDCIKWEEDQIRHIKKEISRCKSRHPTDSDEKISLGEIVNRLNDEKRMAKDRIKELKTIGDSLAYKFFSKYDLKNLGLKQRSGFISDKSGLDMELLLLKEIFENGGIAILNDLTNSIRYGDITELADNNIVLHEVKSSNYVDKRTIRQKSTLEFVQNYLSADYIKNFNKDTSLKRISLNIKEVNYKNKLNTMIEEALTSGVSFEELEKGLYYFVQYGPASKSDSLERSIGTLSKSRKKVYYMNTYKYSESYMYTPIINTFFKPKYYLHFLNGDLIIAIFLDWDILVQRFLSNQIELLEQEENKKYKYKLIFHPAGETPKSMLVSAFYFDRIGRDFLSVEYFINCVKYIFNCDDLQQ